MGWLSGKKSKVKQYSSLSPKQAKVSRRTGDYLWGGLEEGATPWLTPNVAGDPKSLYGRAYAGLSSLLGRYNELMERSLAGQAAGEPAWTYDLNDLRSTFRKDYAEPLMETWRSTIAPIIREGINAVPGAFYSSASGRTITDEANKYFRERVQPEFAGMVRDERQRAFQSAEAAAGRVPGAVSQLAALPSMLASPYMQADVNRMNLLRSDELRMMAENNPYLASALSYLGIPMTTTVGVQGRQGMLGPLIGAAGTIGGAALFGAAGGAAGGLAGGAVGGAASGGSFVPLSPKGNWTGATY